MIRTVSLQCKAVLGTTFDKHIFNLLGCERVNVCNPNILMIHNVPDSQVIGEACGDGYGFKSFQSNIREDMLVLFVTDDTEESAGFRLEYKVVGKEAG